LQIVRIAHEVYVAHGQKVGRARLGVVGQRIKGAAIGADHVVGDNHERLGGQTLGQRRQRAIALDFGIEGFDFWVGGKRHGAACGGFESGKLVLLRESTRRDIAHIGQSHRWAVRISGG